MNKIKLFTIASILLAMFGCASNPMKVSDEVTVEPASANEAQVVFMRNSFVGSAINASLYELTDSDPIFIGIISNGTKLIHKTSSGKHRFMVVSEAADFLEADVLAGKTYYSIVTPRMGAWKARFSMWPIKKSASEYTLDSEDFKTWKKNTKIAENSEKAAAWFASNKASVVKKMNEYLAVWNQKSAEELAKRSLSQEDGI